MNSSKNFEYISFNYFTFFDNQYQDMTDKVFNKIVFTQKSAYAWKSASSKRGSPFCRKIFNERLPSFLSEAVLIWKLVFELGSHFGIT